MDRTDAAQDRKQDDGRNGFEKFVEAIYHRPGGDISALVFSRTETFANPIPISYARRIFPRMADNGYLQTARPVSEHVFADFYQVGRPPR